MCASAVVLLVLPLILGLVAFLFTIFTVYQLLGAEQSRMNDCETDAFKLFDEMFQTMTPKGIVDRFSNGERELPSSVPEVESPK